MKYLDPVDNQEYLIFNDNDIVIIDKLQNLPERATHYSNYIIVLLCTAGRIQIDYDNKVFTVEKGDLFFGVPGSMFSEYMTSPQFDCKILAIKPAEASSPRDFYSRTLNTVVYVKNHPVVKLSETDLKILFDYYNLICHQVEHSSTRYGSGEIRSLVNAFILNILNVFDRVINLPENIQSIHGEKLVERFVWLVNENCGRERFVDFYAKKMNITPKYLSTLVRSSLGRTPTEVITAITLKEIEHMLRYSDKNIKEISVKMNFPNASFFGKYFKHHTGLTPNAYRKKYQ